LGQNKELFLYDRWGEILGMCNGFGILGGSSA